MTESAEVTQPPPQSVLTAFGAEGPVLRLPGGRGTSWRAGDLVLKPAEDPAELAWLGRHLAGLSDSAIRIAHPLAARDGRWVVAGWQATRWLPGVARPGGWADILAAGERFHAAVAHLPRPSFLDAREDPWSVGDRVAWGELAWQGPRQLEPLLRPLRQALRPLPDLPSQLIHGDLGGNVVFAAGEPPGVIDLSPYYRPVSFAAAVLVVDALVWEGADPSILDLVAELPSIDQLLLRAAIYRTVTTGEASGKNPVRLEREVAANADVVALLVARARDGD